MDGKLKTIFSLLNGLTLVETETELDTLLDRLPTLEQPAVVSFVNAHAINLAWNDAELARSLQCSDYLFRDGSGMKILLSLLGRAPGLNANGTDLIPRILSRYTLTGHDAPAIALFGTASPYLERAADHVSARGGRVVATCDGFQPFETYRERLKADPPALLILGMGMPKQEKLSAWLARELNHPCLIVNGGAILDFWAQRFERAPLLFQKAGIEWVYRLIQEPRRLARRYLIGNVSFLAKVLILAFRSRRHAHSDTREP